MAKSDPSKSSKLSKTEGVTMLGSATKGPSKKLEAFPYQHKRDTVITFYCEEFSCHCPVTGQPDFAKLVIEYIPKKKALESKSLKNFLWSYRDTAAFHEDIVNDILSELNEFLSPKWIKVTGKFFIRGGIAIDCEVEEGKR